MSMLPKPRNYPGGPLILAPRDEDGRIDLARNWDALHDAAGKATADVSALESEETPMVSWPAVLAIGALVLPWLVWWAVR